MNLPKLSHLITQANICLHCEVKTMNLWREPVQSNYQQAIIPLLGSILGSMSILKKCAYICILIRSHVQHHHIHFGLLLYFIVISKMTVLNVDVKGKKKNLYFYVDNSNTKLWVVWIECGCAQTQSCLIFTTPWTVACQAPLPMGFSQQEHWTALPFPSLGDLLDQGWRPRLLAGRFFYH